MTVGEKISLQAVDASVPAVDYLTAHAALRRAASIFQGQAIACAKDNDRAGFDSGVARMVDMLKSAGAIGSIDVPRWEDHSRSHGDKRDRAFREHAKRLYARLSDGKQQAEAAKRRNLWWEGAE